MTVYHGGKERIGEHISDIIYRLILDSKSNVVGYCEPFFGMGGVYKHIIEKFGDRLKYKAGDINASVIAMWKALQSGWKPPTSCSMSKYNSIKKQPYNTAEKGYIGHAYSYRGRYFGTYFNNNKDYSSKVLELANIMSNVEFKYGDYTMYSNLKDYVIYCDPPYNDTDQRYSDGVDRVRFNSESFWNWCKHMSINNIVFVSEYTSPHKYTYIPITGYERLYLVI